MLKVNTRNTRQRFGVFIVDFEYIWHIVLVFFADFEHVNRRSLSQLRWSSM